MNTTLFATAKNQGTTKEQPRNNLPPPLLQKCNLFNIFGSLLFFVFAPCSNRQQGVPVRFMTYSGFRPESTRRIRDKNNTNLCILIILPPPILPSNIRYMRD